MTSPSAGDTLSRVKITENKVLVAASVTVIALLVLWPRAPRPKKPAVQAAGFP